MVTFKEVLDLINTNDPSAEFVLLAKYAKACLALNETEIALEYLEDAGCDGYERLTFLLKQCVALDEIENCANQMKNELEWSEELIQHIDDWIYGEAETLLILGPVPCDYIETEIEVREIPHFSRNFLKDRVSYQVCHESENDNGPRVYGQSFWNKEDAILWWNKHVIGL